MSAPSHTSSSNSDTAEPAQLTGLAFFVDPNAERRRVALIYLAYMPLWIGVIGWLMFTKAFAAWGDLGHMAIGLGLGIPAVVLPLVLGGGRFAQRAVFFLVGMAILQNHFGSWFFFYSLGMQYHFPVTWIANRVPIFLHPLTIAYFSTYYTVMTLVYGLFTRRFPKAPTAARWAMIGVLSYAMAFAETFFMDVEMLQQYFSYADRGRALLLGSIAYGTLFVCSFPIYFALRSESRWSKLVWRLLGCNMLILICYEVYGFVMGPARAG